MNRKTSNSSPQDGANGSPQDDANGSSADSADEKQSQTKGQRVWIRTIEMRELSINSQLEFKHGDKDILVCRTDAGIFAIDRLCSHKQLPITGGKMTGNTIACPHHAGKFNLETGKNLAAPAFMPIKAYQVEVIENTIYIAL